MKNFLMLIACVLFSSAYSAESIALEVKDGETLLAGRWFSAAGDGTKPTVLVVHEWWGRNAYAESRAAALTAHGWNALAVDLYGEKASNDFPTAVKRSGPFYQDPQLFVRRLQLFLDAARARPECDKERVSAIGFCFGGSAVLQAARAGLDLKAVVAFHAGLKTSAPAQKKPLARILVCHGGADPFVPADDVASFINEMNTSQANWRMEIFGGAVHAFTNPKAGMDVTNVPESVPFAQAVAHHAEAEEASMNMMVTYLKNIFQ